jgi:rhamnulokinase
VDRALYLAVDLGAGSGRVFLTGLADGELLLEEVRRFRYPPRMADGHLRWDFRRMLNEIKTGLRDGGTRARALGRQVASVGVDSWAVDYGLVDDAGELVEDPICYRDARTAGVMEQVFAVVPREEIVARTGIQCLPFNTLYQLAAHGATGLDPRARHLLLAPDLVHFFLTRRAVAEYTNATTTQMVNIGTRAWDVDLCGRLGVPTRLLPDIVAAGTDVGAMLPSIAADVGLPNVRVVAPATHDTGSAVAGTPLREGWAYISSGTWSLVGVERATVLINPAVTKSNFTNEGGAYDTARFLKNVMGLWILESCRQEWHAHGTDVGWADLVAGAHALPETPAIIDPDDPRLFSPPSMLGALQAQLAETGQRWPESPAGVARMVLDSLAFRYAEVLADIARLTGEPIRGVHIVGGGSLNEHLNQATADAAGVPVVAGPVESTVIGNAVVQAIARGRFASLHAARAHVEAHVPTRTFTPRPSASFAMAAGLYAHLASHRSSS